MDYDQGRLQQGYGSFILKYDFWVYVLDEISSRVLHSFKKKVVLLPFAIDPNGGNLVDVK